MLLARLLHSLLHVKFPFRRESHFSVELCFRKHAVADALYRAIEESSEICIPPQTSGRNQTTRRFKLVRGSTFIRCHHTVSDANKESGRLKTPACVAVSLCVRYTVADGPQACDLSHFGPTLTVLMDCWASQPRQIRSDPDSGAVQSPLVQSLDRLTIPLLVNTSAPSSNANWLATDSHKKSHQVPANGYSPQAVGRRRRFALLFPTIPNTPSTQAAGGGLPSFPTIPNMPSTCTDKPPEKPA